MARGKTLTYDKKQAIYNMYMRSDKTQRQIAGEFGVSAAMVSKIICHPPKQPEITAAVRESGGMRADLAELLRKRAELDSEIILLLQTLK